MSKLGKYMADSAETPPPSKRPTECLVNGCPLPGVYRQTNETSICCVHDEEDAKNWSEQTTRIRNREALWFAALDMTNAAPNTPVSDALLDRLTRAGAPPLKADDDRMTVRRCGTQIKGWLMRECKGEREKAPVDVRRADTWKRLTDTVPL